MIDSELAVEYLKPEIWTNLGAVINPLIHRGKILHILSGGDGKMKGATSDHRDFPVGRFINRNVLNIQSIFEKFSDIIEIRVYTLPGLVSYYRKIQERKVYNKDMDDYLIDLYNIQENTEGIRIYKRNRSKNRCYMETIKSFLSDEVENGVVFVWLTDRDKLFFNCILEFSSGKLKGISTSDRYPGAEERYEVIYSLIRKEYQCRIIPIHMELDEFKRRVKEIL